MIEKGDLARLIQEESLLRGSFELRGGEISPIYFDKFKFEANPYLLRHIVEYLVQLIPEDTEIVAGAILGGIPLAVAVSLETGLSSAFVRPEIKGYGTRKIVEGADVRGRKACVIEDVVTSGGQAIETAWILRKEGAVVDTVVCVINRNKVSEQNLADNDLQLISLFRLNEKGELI